MELENSKFDEISCGLVIFREEEGQREFLILHYPGGHWDFPKGHIEDDDQNERYTACRELEEETGIMDVEFIDGFRDQVTYSYRRKGKISTKKVIFFLAKTEEKEVKLSHEHQGYEWLPYDGAFNKLTFDNAKNLLKSGVKFLEKI